MKGCKFLVALALFASVQLAHGSPLDTFDLFGGNAGAWTIGWYGEAWADSGWCGDTLNKNPDSLNVITCTPATFATMDSNGFYPGTSYINYKYKFRNYYAQLPIVWSNWQGVDSTTVSPYKKLMIVYKGLLPSHQVSLSFFYGTWGFDSALKASDSIKNALSFGDGVGVLLPSTDWKTVVIPIPDSVSLPGITGINFAMGNRTGMGGKTSDIGTLQVARIALVADNAGAISVKNTVTRNKGINNRYIFTPAAGNVAVTAYSLKGEALLSKNVSVQAGQHYSIRQFVNENMGLSASQVRLVKIKGEGVNTSTRIW
jgi:hypothetical protein